MQTFPRIVLLTLLAALGGLIAGCLIGGLTYGFFNPINGVGPKASLATGLFIAMFAIYFGFLPAILFGAPSYALLFKLGYANYPTALILGLMPGLVLLAMRHDLAGTCLAFGGLVAGCTHFLAKRLPPLSRLGPNNSFKPKPLRGSA